MRYYRIVLTNQAGAEFTFGSLGGLELTSLLPSGIVNIGALNIEMDIPVAPYHTPAGQVFLRVWGLGLADIGSAFNLNGMNVAIYAGMSAGLPLANPNQARLLISGQIFQAFGNWIGTEQTVDMLLTPATGSLAIAAATGFKPNPVNYTLNWTAGTTLASALKTTFATSLSKANVYIQLSPRLVQNHDEPAVYGTLQALATFCNQISKKIITDANYPGVQITYDGTNLRAVDLSAQISTKAIAFQDLVGQPTWIAPSVIQAKLVMRGDLDLFDTITLPPSLVGNTAAAMSSLSGNPANFTTFSGTYTIIEIHHYGNFRQPDALSWNTTINMIKQPPALSI